MPTREPWPLRIERIATSSIHHWGKRMPRRIRQLPRPLLEALTQAFRKRFSIPEGATTIADRIIQKRHHDWIEAFLMQHQAAA
jgi:hypothetical protein